jgi:hypothetical protein
MMILKASKPEESFDKVFIEKAGYIQDKYREINRT